MYPQPPRHTCDLLLTGPCRMKDMCSELQRCSVPQQRRASVSQEERWKVSLKQRCAWLLGFVSRRGPLAREASGEKGHRRPHNDNFLSESPGSLETLEIFGTWLKRFQSRRHVTISGLPSSEASQNQRQTQPQHSSVNLCCNQLLLALLFSIASTRSRAYS